MLEYYLKEANMCAKVLNRLLYHKSKHNYKQSILKLFGTD